LQEFADRQSALEGRLAAIEQALAALYAAGEQVQTTAAPAPISGEPAAAPSIRRVSWPHMMDNIFLGLATLLVAHWLATTLPGGDRAVFRLVALIVALPFGFRFERNANADTTGQVLAALAFGSLGTLVISVLDLALARHAAPPLTAQDVVQSVAAIALSHYAGSALAHVRQLRAERSQASAESAIRTAASPAQPWAHLEPARIKTTAEAVKALTDAAAPLVAGSVALWAAFGHILS
jgi:hypothetical protein